MQTNTDLYPALTRRLYNVRAARVALENELNLSKNLPVRDFLESLKELPAGLAGMAARLAALHARRKEGE